MRRLILLAICLTIAPASAESDSIQDVAWLQGCWELRDGDRVVEERWMPPHEGRMLGTGRTTRGGKEVESETINLFEHDGRLAYEAHPSGQPAATFMSRPIKGHEVVFEDPAHDFPQRVGYRQGKPGTLLAWIEGTAGGKTRRVEFAYRRVNCSARPEGGPSNAAQRGAASLL